LHAGALPFGAAASLCSAAILAADNTCFSEGALFCRIVLPRLTNMLKYGKSMVATGLFILLFSLTFQLLSSALLFLLSKVTRGGAWFNRAAGNGRLTCRLLWWPLPVHGRDSGGSD